MNRSQLLVGVALLTVWPAGSVGAGAVGPTTIRISAGTTLLRELPVSVALPADWNGKAVRLIELGARKEVPAQLDRAGGAPRLVWIVDHIAAGQSARYELQPAPAEPTTLRPGVALKSAGPNLEIAVGGQYFTTYLTNAGPKPYCWPVIGPTGRPVTRAYPMERVPGETHDHPHHRSFWFSHDPVNGYKFWSEDPHDPLTAKTVHTKYLRMTSGPVFGEFVSHVDWLTRENKKVCEDVRRMRVYNIADARVFDFEIAVKATEGPVVFGDNKEGTFGFRVATSIDIKQERGKPKGGTLVNSNGERDGKVWGKRADWCDYYGPVDGAVVGIAIFDHPRNLRHPTYWHARDYGLFCANPFGIRHFTLDKNADGSYEIPRGGELRLNYRVVIHKDTTEAAAIADQYAAYAQLPVIKIE